MLILKASTHLSAVLCSTIPSLDPESSDQTRPAQAEKGETALGATAEWQVTDPDQSKADIPL